MPFTTVNNHRIHYEDTQQLGYEILPDKLPMIMIHGLGSSKNYYMPVIPHIVGHRCIALSTYGAALSKSNGERLTLEGLAEDVVGLMDLLKISKAIVVGHSMGGTMACRIAATHPDQAAAIVCIGPVNPTFVDAGIFQSRIESVLEDGMEPLSDIIPQSATGSQTGAQQRLTIKGLLLDQNPRSYASHCQVIIDMRDPGFSAITCPALIIAGDEDKSAPLEGCRRILDNLGSERKELKVLEKIGHWHCIEAPEKVASEILAFASSLETSSGSAN